MAEVWRDAGHEVELPFPRMPYGEALARYGSDKPDLRYGLEIGDVSEQVAGSEFGVFSRAVGAGGVVRCLSVPGAAEALSRKDYDELAEFAKEWGGKGLAYLIFEADGERALADREVPRARPRSPRSARPPAPSPAPSPSSRPTRRPSSSACSAPCGRTSRGASS